MANSSSAALLDDFVAFLNECWTAYHATAEARRRLLAAGFVELDETQPKHDIKVESVHLWPFRQKMPIWFSLYFQVVFSLIYFSHLMHFISFAFFFFTLGKCW